MTPAARSTGLLIREVGDETLVYDLEHHEAHCLNRTAALVLAHADGRRSVADIAVAVAVAAESRSPVDEAAVRVAIEKLSEARLLEGSAAPARESAPSPGRREALRRVGLGVALLAPVVTSVLVPTPAEAAATCIRWTACTRAKYGQPCYTTSQAECANKICTDNLVCQ
jgi:hypothetical protein